MKQWMECHPNLREIPEFQYKIRRSYKLSRPIGEVVAIMMTGDEVLNYKSVYLSNYIARGKHIYIYIYVVGYKGETGNVRNMGKERLRALEDFRR